MRPIAPRSSHFSQADLCWILWGILCQLHLLSCAVPVPFAVQNTHVASYWAKAAPCWATLNRPEGTMLPSELNCNLYWTTRCSTKLRCTLHPIELAAPSELCCSLLSCTASYYTELRCTLLSYSTLKSADLHTQQHPAELRLRCAPLATLTLWATLTLRATLHRRYLSSKFVMPESGIRLFPYWNAKNADTVGNLFGVAEFWGRSPIPESSGTELR